MLQVTQIHQQEWETFFQIQWEKICRGFKDFISFRIKKKDLRVETSHFVLDKGYISEPLPHYCACTGWKKIRKKPRHENIHKCILTYAWTLKASALLLAQNWIVSQQTWSMQGKSEHLIPVVVAGFHGRGFQEHGDRVGGEHLLALQNIGQHCNLFVSPFHLALCVFFISSNLPQ